MNDPMNTDFHSHPRNKTATTVFLALGSNIEPRRRYLYRAVIALGNLGKVMAVAPLYQSRPHGVTGQPDFFNTAVQMETHWSPISLLDALKKLENALGRTPTYRWGPRQIDIDIIFYGHQQIDHPRLQIPHRDYQHRRFVLQPLADIAPDFVAPDTQLPIRTMLARCPDAEALICIQTDWMNHARAS